MVEPNPWVWDSFGELFICKEEQKLGRASPLGRSAQTDAYSNEYGYEGILGLNLKCWPLGGLRKRHPHRRDWADSTNLLAVFVS